jgi:hypothetical protein
MTANEAVLNYTIYVSTYSHMFYIKCAFLQLRCQTLQSLNNVSAMSVQYYGSTETGILQHEGLVDLQPSIRFYANVIFGTTSKWENKDNTIVHAMYIHKHIHTIYGI